MNLRSVFSRVLAIWILFTLILPFGIGVAEKKTCSHKWVLIKSTEPTCTKEGKKVYQCSKCNKQKKEKVKALGHDWAMCMITQKATCTREGITHCICSRNPKHIKNDTIPALGHSWKHAAAAAAEQLKKEKSRSWSENRQTNGPLRMLRQ